MKKVVYTLNINNYLPELCKITIPTIEAYAEKLEAEFYTITERKYPEWPITYEKMQLFELAKNNEWTIFVDADTVISPELVDFTKKLRPDHVGVHMAYDADAHLPCDYFFAKDGRNVGVVTNFMVVHKTCHKIWTPLDESCEFALKRMKTVSAREHIVDEFCISRNLCRYKFLFTGLTQFGNDQFLHLSATVEDDETLERAKKFSE